MLSLPSAARTQTSNIAKPVVIVSRFNIALRDTMLRGVTDRLTDALSHDLASDSTLQWLPADPKQRHPKGPLGETYMVVGGTLPKPDGTLRLDWELKSLKTGARLARDSTTVRPSWERRAMALIAAEISTALRARHRAGKE